MKRSQRPSRSIFLKIMTIMSMIAYLHSVAGWYISPVVWWPLGFASIAFAYLWIALLILAGWWWLKKERKLAAVCILMFVAGFQPASSTFSVGWDINYEAEKVPETLRVMQWNCMELPGNHIGWKKNKDERKAIETFVLQYQPDIICMEDFAEHIGNKLESNDAFLEDSLGFPYKIFAQSSSLVQVFGKSIVGTAIYSRQPFIRSGIIPYTNRQHPESIVWADFLMNGRPVRVVTTHFRSMNLFAYKSYENKAVPYYLVQDSSIVKSKNIISKIKYYQAEHTIQAKQLRAFLDTCSFPVILCSDLNTVPANHIYQKVRGNLKDGFIGSKTGMGNTYNFLLPNLRIDYLLHHPALEARQWKHFANGFFDHDHLMADFSWKTKEAVFK